MFIIVKKSKIEYTAYKTELMIQKEIDSYNQKIYDNCDDYNQAVKEFLGYECSAGKAKRICNIKELKKYHMLKENWFDINIPIMEEINYVKFTYFHDIRDKLIATGDAIIIEGNYWGGVMIFGE